MKLLIVINPLSGGGKGSKVGQEVLSACKKFDLVATVVQENSAEASLSFVTTYLTTDRFDILIAVGGDGLVHDLLPNLVGQKTSLLVIPAGTGNDFARTIGHSSHFGHSSIQKISESREVTDLATRAIDVGILESGEHKRFFVQIVSTGFDSKVNQRANAFKALKGKMKYVAAVVLELFHSRSYPFTINIDGTTTQVEAMLVCIANGSSYGGGMKIVPHAKNDDQQLEVMYVAKVSPIRLLFVFPRVFFGAHVNHPRVHFLTGKQITLTAPTIAFGDGEPMGDLPVTAYLSDQKLRILQP